MLTRRPVLIGLGMTAAAWCARAVAAEDPLTGTWTGILNAGVQLRLKWEIAADGTVTMYSLDQGNKRATRWGCARTRDPRRPDLMSRRFARGFVALRG